jgi:diguanylate cyclase
VIKTVSRKISECIRQIDTAARYGGDEFAVILPNTSLADTVFVAERMVEAVSKATVIWEKQQQPIALSISVGLGQYDAGSSPEDITNRSDRALYTAKKAGKNTVMVYRPAAG